MLASACLAGPVDDGLKIAKEVRNPRLPERIAINVSIKTVPATDDQWRSVACRLYQQYVVKHGFREVAALIFDDYESARDYSTPTNDTPRAYDSLNHEIAEYGFSKTTGKHELDLVRREQEKTIVVKHFEFSIDGCQITGSH